MVNKTNEAWIHLFDVLSLERKLENFGMTFVTGEQIKKICNKEPRLMCKFDCREKRPKIISDNDVTILPVKNGEYVLIKGDGYNELPLINNNIKFSKWPLERELQTLPKEPRSESQVIDLAFATGILTDFLEDEDLILTMRGRLRSAPFNFYFKSTAINSHRIYVDGVQVEVDCGYETNAKVYIIEAKLEEYDDFIVRQLYYPMRMWLEEGVTKPIIPLFITYANEIISISQYQFVDYMDYSSIELVKTINYSFDQNPIKINLQTLLDSVEVDLYEAEPFPQADDIRKVRDTVDMVAREHNSSQKIADMWEVEGRQGDYYTNAAKYLGFLEKSTKGKLWMLTKLGKEYVHAPTTKRDKILIERILKHPVFYYCFKNYCLNQSNDVENIKVILGKYTTLSESTIYRRTRTIKKWIDWLVKNFDI